MCIRDSVMEAKHRLTGEALEQTVGKHRPRATHALFGGLEDEIEDTVEPARFRQISRGAE